MNPTPVVLPPLTGPLDEIWDLLLDFATRLGPTGWLLVGGQMVMLHGLTAGRATPRVSRDVDLLADLVTDSTSLSSCARTLREMSFDPQPDSRGRVYRFRRASDHTTVDLLAPDHFPPRRSLRTARGADTIGVDGGRQALTRATTVAVAKGTRDQPVPVPLPDLLGALILKAAAWISDRRDRNRHSHDAAFLVSLIADPIAERGCFAGSDRRRLVRLDAHLADPNAPEWHALGEHAVDARINWHLLLATD